MSIRLVVTRGYGNGTFNGTIADIVTRGYTIGEAVIPNRMTIKDFDLRARARARELRTRPWRHDFRSRG